MVSNRRGESGAVVLILPLAKEKLDTFVNLAEGEISGLGKVRVLKKGVLLIEDVYLFDQKCTDASTELSQSAVSDFLTDMIMNGDDPSCIRLWWHSHASMNTMWSCTDDGTIAGFTNDWMLSVVTNFKGDYLCRVDSYIPVHTVAHDVVLREYRLPNTDLENELRAEVKQKMKYSRPKAVNSKVLYPAVIQTAESGIAVEEFENESV